MSQNTNYKETFVVECKMSVREYYDFRITALEKRVQFTVQWEKTYAIVTTEAPFLVACGYTEGIDF